jgi:HAD superfamily hydrolase (TIGR01490 family)
VSVAAFFDVDGTITRTTILDPLIWYRRAHDSPLRFAAFLGGLLFRAPYYLCVDRRSRARCNVVFFRQYAGMPVQPLRDWHRRTFPDNLQRTVFPAARDCIRDHQQRGHRIVLVTGGLELVMQPLAEFLHADELIATRLVERNGAFTGGLDGPAIADARKAELARAYADRHGIDTELSFAYGNSLGDAPMLECVGRPVAVNPDGRLRRLARGSGWPIVSWQSGSVGPSHSS